MKWDWLRNDWLVILVIILGTVLMVAASQSVQAAPAADGVVFCTKTATTGPIDIWLCEPDLGPSFIINSVGFMQVVD